MRSAGATGSLVLAITVLDHVLIFVRTMPPVKLRLRPVVIAAFLGLLVSAATVVPMLAAAPPIIIVTGLPLSQPIVLADWEQNIALISSGVENPIGQMEAPQGRPYLDLALFTGEQWASYVETGQPVEALQPSQADEHGRFYPASATEPALLVLLEVQRRGGISLMTWSVRHIDEAGLAILTEHGVPTRLDAADPDTTSSQPQA